MSNILFTAENGKSFWCSPEQADTLNALSELRKGGVGTIAGYRPTSDYITPPLIDVQVITRFSTKALYERKSEALAALSFADVRDAVNADPVLSKLTNTEQVKLFSDRLSGEIASMEKTMNGDRSDAHRQGHDRCYCQIAEGVKVHYVTEKVAGIMEPVLTDGHPTLNSIMVAGLELNRTYREKGERKVVNSGAPVRMTNAINSALNQRSVGYRTFALKEGNFERFTVSRKTFTPADVAEYNEKPLTEAFRLFLTAII